MIHRVALFGSVLAVDVLRVTCLAHFAWGLVVQQLHPFPRLVPTAARWARTQRQQQCGLPLLAAMKESAVVQRLEWQGI